MKLLGVICFFYLSLFTMSSCQNDDEGLRKADQWLDDLESEYDNSNESSDSWPSNEKKAFINSCIENAQNSGASSEYAEDYCNCSLEKVMDAYPDINDVNKASIEELNNLVEDCK